MTVTLNIAAWNLPVGTSLVQNVVAQGFSSEVYTWPLQVPASGNVTFTLPPYSTATITAPARAQTEASLAAVADATLFAGANHAGNFGGAAGLTVSTSTSAVHDGTAVARRRPLTSRPRMPLLCPLRPLTPSTPLPALLPLPQSLIAFDLGSVNPTAVLTAILELTVMTAPASDMLMTARERSPASPRARRLLPPWRGVENPQSSQPRTAPAADRRPEHVQRRRHDLGRECASPPPTSSNHHHRAAAACALRVSALNPPSLRPAHAGSISWDNAPFVVTVPSGQITSPVNNFVR